MEPKIDPIKADVSRISVIIPTYNRKHLIGQTIDCILHQSAKPHEIIVVDDNSTDGTLSWLQETYGNQLILLSNNGKGPGAARNTGLRVATGDFVKFFDSDDIMSPNTLEVQCDTLNSTCAEYVYSPYIHARQNYDGSWLPVDGYMIQHGAYPSNRNLRQWMCRGLFICIPSMMFKRSLLDKVGAWRTDITAYEDWDYLWRIATLSSQSIHTNRCFFVYRIHGDQTTEAHYSNAQRDIDKRAMLSHLKINYFLGLTWLDAIWFDHYLYPNYSGFWSYYFRFIKKIGRLKTNSPWQPEHGVLYGKEFLNKF